MEKRNSLSIGIAEVSANVPVEIREKLNFHTSEIEPIIKDLREEKILLETIFLCTCNRSMLIFITNASKWGEAVSTSLKLLGKWSGNTKIAEHLDLYRDKDALGKLVMLGVGADSAILGEDQILGQIRRFYDVALKHGSTGPILNRIFQTLIFVARKIKMEQQFSKGTVSLSGLVIKKIKEYEKDSADSRKILMIGWGEIFFTIYKILSSDNRNYEIVISNRTLDKIKIDNAKLNTRYIKEESRYFDVIISMTSRMGHVIDRNTFLFDDKNI
jgi:glutamyl-tRNA reductase